MSQRKLCNVRLYNPMSAGKVSTPKRRSCNTACDQDQHEAGLEELASDAFPLRTAEGMTGIRTQIPNGDCLLKQRK